MDLVRAAACTYYTHCAVYDMNRRGKGHGMVMAIKCQTVLPPWLIHCRF